MVLPSSISRDPRYIDRLIPLDRIEDIPDEWRNTPIEALIRAENFGEPIPETVQQPQLLIATCIEFRYALPVPRMYSYVIRRASGRLNGSEFSMAYVISKGVRHIALIGHNDCGMTKVDVAKPALVDALVGQGWNPDRAEEFINWQSARHAMKDELDGLRQEYIRLKRIFKNLVIAPLFVDLADTHLFVPKWYAEADSEDEENAVSDVDLLTTIGN
jgi:carbonic anhydrase